MDSYSVISSLLQTTPYIYILPTPPAPHPWPTLKTCILDINNMQTVDLRLWDTLRRTSYIQIHTHKSHAIVHRLKAIAALTLAYCGLSRLRVMKGLWLSLGMNSLEKAFSNSVCLGKNKTTDRLCQFHQETGVPLSVYHTENGIIAAGRKHRAIQKKNKLCLQIIFG